MTFKSFLLTFLFISPTIALAQGTVTSPRYPSLTITNGINAGSISLSGSGSTGDVSGMTATPAGSTTPQTLANALRLGGGAVSITTSGGTLTLTEAQLASRVIKLTGTLTSSLMVNFPTSQTGSWTIINATSGAFTVTAQVTGQGSGALNVPAGQPRTVSSDGTALTSPVSQATGLTTPTTTVTGNLAAWGDIGGRSLTDSGILIGTGGNALCPLGSLTACVYTTTPALGTGALQRQFGDGTVANGNTRPANAVDLQQDRYAATQVASGGNSVIGGGSSNAATGQTSTVAGGYENVTAAIGSAITGGFTNLANGSYSRGGGWYSSARGRFGIDCFASGRFSVQGDAQSCTAILRASTSSTTATRLTADGAAVGGANCINIPDNTAVVIEATLAGRDTTAVGAAGVVATRVLLDRRSGAASTVATVQNAGSAFGSGTGVSGVVLASAADTTNGCYSAMITAPNADTWHWVLRAQIVEVQ